MRLGSKTASPLEGLDDRIQLYIDEYHTDVEAALEDRTLSAHEASIFWDDLRKEVTSRRKIYGSANSNRVERELLERFGAFFIQTAIPDYGHVRGLHAFAHAVDGIEKPKNSVGGKAIRRVHGTDGIKGAIGIVMPIDNQ